MSIWSSITAVVEFGMVLPHFVREPALRELAPRAPSALQGIHCGDPGASPENLGQKAFLMIRQPDSEV